MTTHNPYELFLGIPKTAQEIDLFELIGVDFGEENPSTLKRAIQLAGAKLQQADKQSDPAGWRVVVEHLRKAQSVLMDAAQRSAYIEAQQIEKSKATLAAAADDMAPYLPAGNPSQPFDMVAYMQAGGGGGTMTLPSAETRLADLLSILATGSETPQPVVRSGGALSSSDAAALRVGLAGTGTGARVTPRGRGSRTLSSFLTIGLMLGGAMAFLGFAVYLYLAPHVKAILAKAETRAGDLPDSAFKTPEVKSNGPPVDNVMGGMPKPTGGKGRKGQRSGLPTVLGEDGMPAAGGGNSADDQAAERMMANTPDSIGDKPAMETPPMETPPMETPEMAPPAQPAPPPPSEPAAPPMEEMKDPPPGDMAAGDMPAGETPAPPAVTLTEEEWKKWIAGMEKARKSLATWDVKTLREELEAIKPLTQTEKQQLQAVRLETLGDLVEKFEKALRRSLDKVGAGEAFTVGSSTEVGFVGKQGDKFTIRVNGKNQTFTLRESPLAVAYALVDMSLSPDDPTTKAIKASVALVNPKKIKAATDQATKWIDEAVAAQVLDGDFMQVIDEKYEVEK